MNAPIKLSDVPRRFLNPTAWAKLRAFAPNDLLALTYINAFCPDEANPNDFFWDRPGSAADAMRCYKTGRSLLRQSRSHFVVESSSPQGETVVPNAKPYRQANG